MQDTHGTDELLESAEGGSPVGFLDTTNSDLFSSRQGMLHGQPDSSAPVQELAAAEPPIPKLRIRDMLQQHKTAGAHINHDLGDTSGDIRQFLRRGWKPPTQLHNASGAHPTCTPRSTAEDAPSAARPTTSATRRSSDSVASDERRQATATSSAATNDRLQPDSLGDRASLGSLPNARSMSLVRQPSLAERKEMFTNSEIAQEALANSGTVGKCEHC